MSIDHKHNCESVEGPCKQYRNNQDVKLCQRKSSTRPTKFEGAKIWLCAECRKSLNGSIKLVKNMKTISFNVYTFSELSKAAQETAVSEFKEIVSNVDLIKDFIEVASRHGLYNLTQRIQLIYGKGYQHVLGMPFDFTRFTPSSYIGACLEAQGILFNKYGRFFFFDKDIHSDEYRIPSLIEG